MTNHTKVHFYGLGKGRLLSLFIPIQCSTERGENHQVAKARKIEDKHMTGFQKVKLWELQNVIEIMGVERESTGPPITRISRDEFVWHDTGEVGTYNHAITKADAIESLKRTLANGRRIICNNFSGGPSETMMTLTYAENMTDTKKAYFDFNNLMVQMRQEYGGIEYIMAMEPQGRGAWHMHVLLKSDDGRPFRIDAKWLYRTWKKGRVHLRPIDNIDNAGAYLTAYLANMEQPDGEIESEGKRYKKGARLKMYPAGMRIFRYSKGIKKPEPQETTYAMAKQKVGVAASTYTKTVEIIDDSGHSINTIWYEQYNTKRVSLK